MYRIKIYKMLLRLHYLFIVIPGVLLVLIIPKLVGYLPYCKPMVTPKIFTESMETGPISFFIFIVFFVPALETWLFQSLLIRAARNVLIKIHFNRFVIPIIFSGFIFGINHFYNFHYMISQIFTGAVFALIYRVFMLRKESSFWIVTIIHSINNLVVFNLNYFSN